MLISVYQYGNDVRKLMINYINYFEIAQHLEADHEKFKHGTFTIYMVPIRRDAEIYFVKYVRTNKGSGCRVFPYVESHLLIYLK